MPHDGKVTRWLSEVGAQIGTSARTRLRAGRSRDDERCEHRSHSAIRHPLAAKTLRERDGRLPPDYYSMALDPRMV